jgi:hypothetical protein
MIPSALAPPLLAAAFVLAGALDYDPQILTLRWPDGHEERIAATSPDTCKTAVRAVQLAIWPADQPPPVSASCGPGNVFAPGSDCIVSFNCGRAR